MNDRITSFIAELSADTNLRPLIPFVQEMGEAGASFNDVIVRLQRAAVIARGQKAGGTRQQVESIIARSCIADLIAAGFELTVYDGEDETVIRSRDADEIFEAMFTTDEDQLLVWKPGEPDEDGCAFVRFIYGNSGWDVISDYSTSLEEVIKPTNRLAERLAPDWDGDTMYP